MGLVRFPSPAIAYPRQCLGLADGQGNHQEASVVSGIAVPPDDLDHDVGQALGSGKDVRFQRKAPGNRAGKSAGGAFRPGGDRVSPPGK
jgi:hypothetical protein